MNNFLEKLTNNVDIEPVAREYINFLVSCNKDINENIGGDRRALERLG